MQNTTYTMVNEGGTKGRAGLYSRRHTREQVKQITLMNRVKQNYEWNTYMRGNGWKWKASSVIQSAGRSAEAAQMSQYPLQDRLLKGGKSIPLGSQDGGEVESPVRWKV